MMFPDEGSGSAAPEAAPAPQTAPDSASPPTPAASAPDTSGDLPTQAPKTVAPDTEAKPRVEKPEPSLREKIQAKADARMKAEGREKDPRTGKFLPKKAENTPETPQVPGAKETPPPVAGAVVPAADAAFKPDFKVKVMEQEREIPKFLQPLMKDAASSKEVKELVEKAYGLEYVKPKLEEARSQLQTVSNEYGQMQAQVRQAAALYQRGDMEGFFRQLQVSPEKVLQWVADKVEFSKLPADQQQLISARQQAEDRANLAEQQANAHRQQAEQNLTAQVQMTLDSELAKPEVAAIAKAYDDRLGKPGSFKAEVNRRGDYAWSTTNKVLPPAQVVAELLAVVGPQTAPPAASPPAPAVAPAAAAPATKVPTIPNISGRSVSPVGTQVRSIADLKAKHKELVKARQG